MSKLSYKYILLSSIILLVSKNSFGFAKFENFYKNPLSQRTGLEFYNGEYGQYKSCTANGCSLIGKITSNDNTPLNMWFQWGIHNAYAKEDASLYQILRDHTTEIEIDIHAREVIGGNSQKDWRVAHTIGDFWSSGEYYSNCLTHNSNINSSNLSHCLDTIMEFHKDFPEHHLITVWIELKDNALSNNDIYQNAHSLDELLESKLGTILFSPLDLLGSNANLREATKDNWPTLGSLKGKVMIVLMDPLDSNSELREYVNTRGNSASAFVAPNIAGGSVDRPEHFLDEKKNSIIFYSLKGDSYSEHSHGLNIMRLNRISSTWALNASNTPAVSEYRDFFIQRGRGDGSSNNRNPKWSYSGRLIENTRDNTELSPVVEFHTGASTSIQPLGSNCLTIEASSLSNKADLAYGSCSNTMSQFFAVVDVAIDYDQNDFPISRGYLLQALTSSNSGKTANPKVIEVQGGCCTNTQIGREIFQYSRENTSSNNRNEDQYWNILPISNGFNIENINSHNCISTSSYSSFLNYCSSTNQGRYFKAKKAPTVDTPTSGDSNPIEPPDFICGPGTNTICP